MNITNYGLYHYCNNCGAFIKTPPTKHMKQIMKRKNILTWTIAKTCKRCKMIDPQLNKELTK